MIKKIKSSKIRNILLPIASRILSSYIGFVYHTSKVSYFPNDAEGHINSEVPAIMAFWHGQFLMLPTLRPKDQPVKVMVARHEDADLLGRALMHFDVGLVRGAGAGIRQKNRGGATALRESLRFLKEGTSITMTADIPPGPARKCGMGLITMAQKSGPPYSSGSCCIFTVLDFQYMEQIYIELTFFSPCFCCWEAYLRS